MLKNADKGNSKNRRSVLSQRLQNKNALFSILAKDPNLTAAQLRRRASERGIDLSLISAYRALKSYRQCGGKLENSESKCLRLVSSLLQSLPAGIHLSAREIEERVNYKEDNLHRASVYRVLLRLKTLNLVSSFKQGRETLYEWKIAGSHHGHLRCLGCGKTVEFFQDYLSSAGKQICQRLGYEYLGVEIDLCSFCPDCR